MSKKKYWKFIIPSLTLLAAQICTVSHVEYFVNFYDIIFSREHCSKEIEALHNIASFSKLSHGHFSVNITKFSV